MNIQDVPKIQEPLLKDNSQIQINKMEGTIFDLPETPKNNEYKTESKIDLHRAKHLLQNYKDKVAKFNDKGLRENPYEEQLYNQTIAYLNKLIYTSNNKGIRTEYYSKEFGFGRKYGTGSTKTTLGQLTRPVRKFITQTKNWDLDFSRCFQTIISAGLEKAGLPNHYIKSYIEKRKEMAEQFGMEEGTFKQIANAIVCGGFIPKEHKDNLFLQGYKQEVDNFKKMMFELNPKVIKKLQPALDKKKEKEVKAGNLKKDEELPQWQKEGTLISYMLAQIEDECLMILCNTLQARGFVISSLCWDGCLVQIKGYLPKKVMKEAEKNIFERTGIPMKITEKSLDTDVELPNPYDPGKSQQEKLLNDLQSEKYLEAKRNYEENDSLCRLSEIQGYLWKEGNTYNLYKSDKALKEAIVDSEFINLWLRDPNRKLKSTFGMMPPYHPDIGDEKIENIWKGFKLEKLSETLTMPEMWGQSKPVIRFIRLVERVSGEPLLKEYKDNEIEYHITPHLNWLLQWIAHMVQYPGLKPQTAIVFSGEKGIGKGTLSKILTRLLRFNCDQYNAVNEGNIFKCFDRFNSIRLNTLLHSYDEAQPKDLKKYMQEIKNAITEPRFACEIKCKGSFTAPSYDRHMFLTNSPLPVPIEDEGDRRFALFRATTTERLEPELAIYYNKMCENDNELAEIFHFLKNYEVDRKQLTYPPKTKLRLDSELIYRDPKKDMLIDFCQRHSQYKNFEISAKDFFCFHNEYMSDSRRTSFDSPQKLGLYLRNNWEGYFELIHKVYGSLYRWNLNKLREHFNLPIADNQLEDNLSIDLDTDDLDD